MLVIYQYVIMTHRYTVKIRTQVYYKIKYIWLKESLPNMYDLSIKNDMMNFYRNYPVK